MATFKSKKVMNNEELIEALNHALNREITTFLRYLLQAAKIKGAAWESVWSMYREEVSEEVGHAQYLAERIVMLGGTALLAPNMAPVPADPQRMLENDIEEDPPAGARRSMCVPDLPGVANRRKAL
jgi:bacterioferritin